MSKLLGKARDIVNVTLHSNPLLRPDENPKMVVKVLKQHFSELTYSLMPLADFYNTMLVTGESAMEY